jgi:alcohol dehydrogenase
MSSASVLRAPRTVLFGCGAIDAAGPSLGELGQRPLICTDQTLIESESAEMLLRSARQAGVEATVWTGTTPELPRTVIDECLELARSSGADVIVGFGGGSCLDIAKLTALRLSNHGSLDDYVGENRVTKDVMPVVAIPTTAGTGSEVSPVAVFGAADGRMKVGISSPRLVPQVAICDPQTTLACPPSITSFAGIDALIHGVESYLARPHTPDWGEFPGPVFRGSNPLTAPVALNAIRLIAGCFERVLAAPQDRDARSSMMLGSLQAGLSFAQAGNGAIHALQYPIGARTGTPHGLGIGLLAPYVLEHLVDDCAEPLAEIAAALGVEEDPRAAVDEIARLVRVGGIPRTLAEIGMAESDLPQVAADAAAIDRLMRNAPIELDAGSLEQILTTAWCGEPAEASYEGRGGDQ